MALPEPIPPLDAKTAKAFEGKLKHFRFTEDQLATYRAEHARRSKLGTTAS